MAFGCNDDYDTVRDRLVKEFKIDDSVVLLDMEDNLVDHKNFSIYQYVQNHKKYCGATRIYIGILLCLRVNDKSGLDENQSRSGSVEEATQKSAANENQSRPGSVEEATQKSAANENQSRPGSVEEASQKSAANENQFRPGSVEEATQKSAANENQSRPGSVEEATQKSAANENQSRPGSVEEASQKSAAIGNQFRLGTVEEATQKSAANENQSRPGSVEEATQKSAANENQSCPGSVEEATQKSAANENQSHPGSVEEATQKSAADNNQPGPCSVEEAIECIRKEVKELKNRSADLDSEGLENIDTEKFCPVFADPKILCFEKEMNKTYSHVLCGYGNFIIVPKDEMDIFETWKTKNKNLFFVDEAILYFLSYVYNDEEVVNVKEVATNVWQLDAEVADKFRTWKEAMVAAYCKDTCNM